jgi:transcriptional regulator with XRE-family HTH domain
LLFAAESPVCYTQETFLGIAVAMTKQLPPTVRLDSSAVRRIREEKKLTQFYVSKVVNVTTDTISRWENNRYPTVKRENALRLAEALEVEVEAILEKSEEPGSSLEDEGGFSPLPGRGYRWGLALVVAGILAATLFIWRGQHQATLPFNLAADRWLPRYASPGSVIPVHIHLETDTGLKGYILREHFPAGWQLIEAGPPPSSLDNEQGTARWIIKPGEARKVISYLVKVDQQAPVGDTLALVGEIVIGPEGRSKPIPVRGSMDIEVAPYHWADLNGDGRIDDGEMLLASDTFAVMKEVHLDWNRLEKIWDSGSYRWDAPSGRFVPAKSVPSAAPANSPPSSDR